MSEQNRNPLSCPVRSTVKCLCETHRHADCQYRLNLYEGIGKCGVFSYCPNVIK